MHIHVEQLRDDVKEKIYFDADPAFIGVSEKELSFPMSVHIEGEAYVTPHHLILQLSCKTEALLPCAICNSLFSLPIAISLYHTEELPLEIFDYSSVVREEILLQIPAFAECHQGCCPEREGLFPFLKKIPHNFPFSNL